MTLTSPRRADRVLPQPPSARWRPAPALSQATYPSQGINFIIPAGAGGLPDTVARIIGRRLQEKVGQSVVIENKPGGNGASRSRR